MICVQINDKHGAERDGADPTNGTPGGAAATATQDCGGSRKLDQGFVTVNANSALRTTCGHAVIAGDLRQAPAESNRVDNAPHFLLQFRSQEDVERSRGIVHEAERCSEISDLATQRDEIHRELDAIAVVQSCASATRLDLDRKKSTVTILEDIVRHSSNAQNGIAEQHWRKDTGVGRNYAALFRTGNHKASPTTHACGKDQNRDCEQRGNNGDKREDDAN